MSGSSNVIYYLNTHGLPSTADIVQAVTRAAKHSTKILTLEEVRELVHRVTGSEGEQASERTGTILKEVKAE